MEIIIGIVNQSLTCLSKEAFSRKDLIGCPCVGTQQMNSIFICLKVSNLVRLSCKDCGALYIYPIRFNLPN